ncbi:ring finger domain-containing protein [Neofusicoccum parvum]|uniref:Ring finger domain-containing protein n=1 Tax=Neofusicoccum parvum TaxID=310453 RepID=A0ACB5S1Q7_9PEZI|nr:ring finger domain-containing protein [Neofusicoccum parvum]
MDSTNPSNGWPHHRIPKRAHDDMQRGRRESPDQPVRRYPPPFHRQARSPPSTSSTPPPSHQHPQTSGLHLPPLRNRFPGDGLDFRRPAMSTSQASSNARAADVIDLTSEDEPSAAGTSATPIAQPMQSARASRPPRFAREIIDLSDDTPPHPPAHSTAQNRAPSSPEVEFVSARPIPARRPAAPAVDLTDDDLVFDGTFFADFGGLRHGVNRAPPGEGGFRTRSQRNSPTLHRRFLHILGERRSVQNQQQQRRRERRDQRDTQQRGGLRAPYIQRLIGRDPDGLLEIHAPPMMNFMGPGAMNYDVVGFHLGGERESSPATYEAPSKAPPGFTRSPEEVDVLVCPNCDAELCAGPDGGDKRQVWIIRACGHAYCGECANNRHASKRKGKEPVGSTSSRLPNPFQKCVVKDCGKKCAARTAMIQLFL